MDIRHVQETPKEGGLGEGRSCESRLSNAELCQAILYSSLADAIVGS